MRRLKNGDSHLNDPRIANKSLVGRERGEVSSSDVVVIHGIVQRPSNFIRQHKLHRDMSNFGSERSIQKEKYRRARRNIFLGKPILKWKLPFLT